MRRFGALLLTLLIMALSVAGMWMYQSWKEGQNIGEKTIKNTYIIKKKGGDMQVYSKDGKIEIAVKKDLKDTEYTGIADVNMRKGVVEKLVCKPEIIKAKVLAVESGSIDVENYGTLPRDEECTWFSVKNEISYSSEEHLYIGQKDVGFAVAEGKICSVLFYGDVEKAEIKEGENIRVMIKTDNFAQYEHATVTLEGTKNIYVKEGKSQKEYQAGEKVSFSSDSMKEKRVSVSSEEGGEIRVCSIKRGQGNPTYRGEIEIVKAEGGVHIINELPLEQYLYGVIPSEMPADYHAEALKAQAVCARSYAVRHIKNNRLKEMGAHVDDSVSYQVYNNTEEDERCNQAVDATRGKKAYYDGTVASTYFFSTSCGVTTSAEDVMFTGEEVPYLIGKLQEAELGNAAKMENANLVSDTFAEEDLFRKFLEDDRNVFDKSQPWYRWSTTISAGDMENNINSKIGARCEAVPDKIQVRQPDGTYASQKIDSIGKLKKVRIKKRKSGGVVYMAVIVGSEATVRVYSEYNIRMLLFCENAIVRKNDGTNVSGMSILPSGFFVLDKSGSSYEFKGGGFGHGTGMSQTGANELAQVGKTCEEILAYYFSGVEVRE